jgi:hypothetical protein
MEQNFTISLKGINYDIEIVEEDSGEIEVFVDRKFAKHEDEIPEEELLFVIEYLIKEGFVKEP